MIASIDPPRSRTAPIEERDPRARRSIEALHEALITLIERQPFDQITIDHIVAQAGVGRSTFYRHYATKEDLIDAVARTEIEHLTDVTYPLLTLNDTRAGCPALAHICDERQAAGTCIV